ncbi:MAG: DUF4388 domain-containing protein [Deltaproteobacteria bacterium]|nr:DUF4388 domain-containing protein [Deltaproteobacteria bacterium]
MSLRDNLPPEADRPSEKEGRETGSFTVVPLTEDMEFVEPNPTRLHIQMLPDGRFRAPSPDTRKIVRDRLRNAEFLPTGNGWAVVRSLEAEPTTTENAPREREVVAAGVVSERGLSIIDFIGFLANSYQSGILTVACGEVERSVYLHQGDVVWASSTAPADRLGEFLLRHGKITGEQLQIAVRDGEKRIGRACVERGFMAAHELWAMVQAQLTDVFDKLLAMDAGVWSFSVASAQALAESQIHLSTQGLLVDALRRLDEMTIFRQQIRSGDTVIHRLAAAGASESMAASVPEDLRDSALALLAQFPVSATVHELMRIMGRSEFDTTRLAYHLVKTGALVIHPESIESGPATRRVFGVSKTQGSEVIGIYSMAIREMFGEVAAIGRLEELRSALHTFLVDHESAGTADQAPLVNVTISADGILDEEQLIANAQRLGLSAQALSDALSELLFFALFQATEFLGRRRGDDLARRVKVIQSMLSSTSPPNLGSPP